VLVDDPDDGPIFVSTPAGGTEPTGVQARNVAARGPADIWVVGDGTLVAPGLVMRYDGVSWTIVDPGLPVGEALGSVALPGDGTAWALPRRTRTYLEASTDFTTHDAAWWDGAAWSPFDLDGALGGANGFGVYDAVVDGDGVIWLSGYAYQAPDLEPPLLPVPMVAARRCPGPPSSDALGRLVRVGAGAFEMGCVAERDDTGAGCNPDELPPHEVRLTRALDVMESEVTQGMWEAQMGNNPSFFRGCGAACPVERVNWWEALAFANAASEADGLDACYSLEECVRTPGTDLDCEGVTPTPLSGDVRDCGGYRLPTEAEWEYLARGGEDHAYAGSDDPDAVAWHYDVSSTLTHAVCLKERNGFGLCDMSGNVWEWTASLRYDYPDGPVVDPAGGDEGLEYVFRGGHWNLDESWSRVARRFSDFPGFQAFGLGFRLVRSVP
jgi:formylglycine-generating enzyme required for sulfatase activity